MREGEVREVREGEGLRTKTRASSRRRPGGVMREVEVREVREEEAPRTIKRRRRGTKSQSHSHCCREAEDDEGGRRGG